MEQTQANAVATAIAPFVALQAASLQWYEDLLKTNKFPLSGNVDQLIKTSGEAGGQIGFLNVNVANSGKPPLKPKMGSSFSYGRQLGRILDVLAPLVEANASLFDDEAGAKAVKDFDDMVRTIRNLKKRSVSDMVDDVKQWEGSSTFQADLATLLSQLGALQK